LKPRLSEELEDYGSKWIEELPKVVWGLHTQASRAAVYSPFFLVYGSEVVLPVDLIRTSPKIEQYEEGEAEHTRRLELDNAEEVRVNATLQSALYLQDLRRHYNKSTKQRSVQVGDLLLQRIQKIDRRHKLLSPWEDPFIVAKVSGSGTYKLMNEDGVEVRNTWHISQLRRFYARRTQDKIYVATKQCVIKIHNQ
jgi:hypothetical protein